MPCPHDGPCALLPQAREACAFGQTFDPPAFMRDTKHVLGGYHDTAKHSYVVFRRGPRPEDPGTALGRVGVVGRREEEKQRSKQVREMQEQQHGEETIYVPEPVEDLSTKPEIEVEELKAALRKEAMFWPRLNMPPLKKSGHIVMDACTQDGARRAFRGA